MKTIFAAALLALVAGSTAFARVEPIPGSITYENPEARLQKAPAGSSFPHSFLADDGTKVNETYRVNNDKTLTLVERSVSSDT
ncbi:hypothetical protein [Rhizobium sp. RU36D]|uniref:hypothetical protein n=1 Tax=Rhizobium sp. RU36D TaxID=1907415 RepID=UPI0009D806A7|nr:hypothetical protein [Rhizobium sp. RU36D]SMD13812.1 hypothetical protein SAMN05880593_12548 [Rhizobium sp. RU36D]